MLDDGAGSAFIGRELGNEFVGRVGVVDVVVGKFLTLHLFGGGNAIAFFAGDVESGFLMRVLAVAQRLAQLSAQCAAPGRSLVAFLGEFAGEPAGDFGIVGRGAGIGDLGELAAQRQRGGAIVGIEFGQHGCVIFGIDHHRHIVVVLGGGADHGGAADVDILDRLLIARAFGDGGFERVEVRNQQIDALDRMILHRLGVFGVVANAQEAAMNLGVQRLHAPIHDFREAGDFGNIGYLQAGIAQGLGGASGRDQLHVAGGERGGEGNEACFVENRKQRATDRAEGHWAAGNEVSPGLTSGGSKREGFRKPQGRFAWRTLWIALVSVARSASPMVRAGVR